jgi:hypothetical protein
MSWNKAPIWGLRPDFFYCQIIASLLMWGAFSGERMGLSFAIAPGPRQRSSVRVRVPWYSWPFRRLLRLAGLRWRYSTPPLLFFFAFAYDTVLIENDASNNSPFVACIRCWGNVFTGSLPSNDKGIHIQAQRLVWRSRRDVAQLPWYTYQVSWRLVQVLTSW